MSVEGSGQSTDLLFEVVRALTERGIQYAVIGAMAVSVHGVVRASVDADALVSAAFSELRALGDHLTAQGLTTELRRGDIADPIPGMLIVTDRHDNRVDLLMGLRGLDANVYQRAIDVQLPEYTHPLRVASKEDVIAMKLFAGGPLDLQDAKRLIAVAGGTLDTELLRSLVVRFGKDAMTQYEKLLSESPRGGRSSGAE
jgi:hypothetical protein